MNAHWHDFLLSEQATFKSNPDAAFPVPPFDNKKRLYSLAHLGVLLVSGKDAAILLQGQVTCNVQEITAQKAIFGAMCNPKGRVISTFLALKKHDDFLLILPKVLLESVKKRLQMYVLRSKVILADSSDTLCVLGLLTQEPSQSAQFASDTQEEAIFVSLSATQNRQLIVADTNSAIALWTQMTTQQGFQADNADAWRCLDILSGIPWLDIETSEEHIPQMLNVDKLGGISFNKGCYTGQEIVARTHYLGKTKRALFVAECASPILPLANAPVFDDNADNPQAVGSVLMAHTDSHNCKLLLVLNITEITSTKLTLADQTQLTLLA